MKKLALLLLLVFTFGSFITVFNQKSAQAAFQKKNIIDDSLFIDADSMSTSQIQSWLNSNASFLKNWVDNVDHYATFTYHTNPNDPNSPTANVRCKVHRATGMTAAQIIKEASKDWQAQQRIYETQILRDSQGNYIKSEIKGCGTWTTWADTNLETVSPKVILATLQKEQSLITASGSAPTTTSAFENPTNTSTNAYKLAYAMGYAVPDTGGKDQKYKGFYNQINWGAWQLRFNFERSGGNVEWDNVGNIEFTYYFIKGRHLHCSGGAPACHPYTNSSGYYHDGRATIDGDTFEFENRATASLYRYTPHKHGNELFVGIYEGWFGPVHSNWSFKVTSQKIFSDNSKSNEISSSNLSANQRAYIQFKAKNTGNSVWTNSGDFALRVGTTGPLNRSSDFCDVSTWDDCTDPGSNMIESSVSPGQTGTFEFWVTAPSTTGIYDERFKPVISTLDTPLSGDKAQFNILIGDLDWTLNSQNIYTDQTKSQEITVNELKTNSRYFVEFTGTNDGDYTWTNSGEFRAVIGTSGPKDRVSEFCDSTWNACQSPGTPMIENSVATGETATFQFWIKTPSTTTSFDERFKPKIRRIDHIQPDKIQLLVDTHKLSWQEVSSEIYTDQTKSLSSDITHMYSGERAFISIRAKNTGTNNWSNSGSNRVQWGTSNPIDRVSEFCDVTWNNCDNPGDVLVEPSVAPGEIGTFEFWITAPNSPGTYDERFKPSLLELGHVQPDKSRFVITVEEYRWKIGNVSYYKDDSKSENVDINNLVNNQEFYVVFEAINDGSQIWENSGSNKLVLGTSNQLNRTSEFCHNTWSICSRPGQTMLENQVVPGETATIEFWLKAPNTLTGKFDERFKPFISNEGFILNEKLKLTPEIKVHSWSLQSYNVFSNNTKATVADLANMSAGDRVYIQFKAKNIGTATWYNTGTFAAIVGTSGPLGRDSDFCDEATWNNCSEPGGTLLEASISPGEIGTFEFWYEAPSVPGIYDERFKPIIANSTSVQPDKLQLTTTVN